MRTIKAGEGQTLIDIAMQYCGDSLSVFAIAELNGLGITDDLTIGQVIIIPDTEIEKLKIQNSFSSKDLYPASKEDDTEEVLDGIDYWYVEDDFIVR